MKQKNSNYQLSEDDILYFLHIPKTAGTTLVSILDDHFDLENICKEHDVGQLLKNSPKDFTNYRLIRGHFGYGIYHSLHKKPIFITMLRDPVKQIPSMYSQMQRDFFSLYHKEHKNVRLFDALNNPTWRGILANNQTRHLAIDLDVVKIAKSLNKEDADKFIGFTSLDFTSPNISEHELLEIAKKHLSEFKFFGLVEKFEESLLLLCYTFGWRPIRNIIKENVSRDKPHKEFDEKTKDAILQCTKIDRRLYNHGKKLFDTRFSQMVQELKDKYYENSFSNLSFKEMMYELLERHYENTFYETKKMINSVNYSFDQSISGSGWYHREIAKDAKTIFRWSGPETKSTIDFPLLADKEAEIKFHVILQRSSEILESLRLKVNDVPLDIVIISKEKGFTFRGFISPSIIQRNKKFTRLSFEVNKTISPKSVDPNSTDERVLGIALDSIEISTNHKILTKKG